MTHSIRGEKAIQGYSRLAIGVLVTAAVVLFRLRQLVRFGQHDVDGVGEAHRFDHRLGSFVTNRRIYPTGRNSSRPTPGQRSPSTSDRRARLLPRSNKGPRPTCPRRPPPRTWHPYSGRATSTARL